MLVALEVLVLMEEVAEVPELLEMILQSMVMAVMDYKII